MRVFFLRDHRKFPVACVASELVAGPSADTKSVVFSMAIHNPSDKYDRHLGKAKAIGRLKGHQYVSAICFQPKSVRVDVLTAIIHNKTLPARVRAAAKYRLANPTPPRVRRPKGDDQLIPLAHA